MPIPKTFINTNPNNLTLAEIREKNYRNGYEMAIYDFVNECIGYEHLTFEQEHIERIQAIAEQLKVGVGNEQRNSNILSG